MGRVGKNQIRVSFIGGNADGVTGSMTLVSTQEMRILLEAGLVQSNDLRSDYYTNKRRLPFKPKAISYIFLGHVHSDHSMLIPRLVAEGFTGRIIAPTGTSSFFRVMGADSAHIIQRDAETLSIKYGIPAQPIYTDTDVENAVSMIDEYPIGTKFELTPNLSFRFSPAGHIINSAQCELWIKSGNKTRKILMTSDLGNTCCEKFYTNSFVPVSQANLAIVESTYGDAARSVSRKDRSKDLEKMESVIRSVCVDRNSRVLIPIFSLDRCQNIMTHLHQIFAKDQSFSIKVLIDSPLAKKMCDLYLNELHDEQLELWQRVMSWENFVFPDSYQDSKAWMDSKTPCVILGASGFMQAGRSRQWAKLLLPDDSACIMFVGFASENALAGKIKEHSAHRSIKIDGRLYPNRCSIVDLKSFSSHMQRDDMLRYYASIDAERIALVHGEMDAKIEFSSELIKHISRNNRTGRVICVNKSTELCL